MTQKKYSELRDGIDNSTPRSQTIIPFEQGGLTYKGTVDELTRGSSVVSVFSPDDLPPLIDGFRTLAQGTSYMLMEPITLSDKILVPAGWNGWLYSTFVPLNGITYTGAGALFNTLNIDGAILSIADSGTEPGVKSTVTTSSPHGLLNGQYVNITGTLVETGYSQLRLLISNVTASTFDIEIVFTATDTGLFDTGYDAFKMDSIGFTGNFTNDLFDLTASTQFTSLLTFYAISGQFFLNGGIIRNSLFIVGSRGQFLVGNNGLQLEDCDTVSLDTSPFINFNPANTTGICLQFKGSKTRDILITSVKLNTANAAQTPINLASSVSVAAIISISNTPDNGVSTDYFVTTAGGLDQTDPAVITKNNGSRPNSMSSAQVGFTNISTPIVVSIVTQDVPVIIGGTQFTSNNLERATANNAGQITNLTKVTRKYPITFSALIEKAGGGSTDIGLLIIKNGSLVLTDTFNIPHSVNAGVIQISATRDFELADGDTIELAVVNFSGTANIEVSQANIVYSVEA